MTVLKTSVWVLVFGLIFLLPRQLWGQSIQEIPIDIDFAGVTVHLNEQSRVQVQREVGQLYANRAGLQRDIESLRQLAPLLEPLLKGRQLPMDYRYAVLPFAGAAPTGYWGLSSARALALNMVVDRGVDERFHPTVATETVVAHLSRLHKVSDNYALTLLRYIQADTLTNRLADKVNSAYIVLDAQSPALMWKIIARKLAFEREEPLLRPTQTYLVYEVRQASGSSLQAIGRRLLLDEERFKPFNAWLKTSVIPDTKEYPVLVRVMADEFPAVQRRDNARLGPGVIGEGDVGFPTLTKLPQSTVSTFEPAMFYRINDQLGVQAQPCDNAITLSYYGRVTIKNFLSYNELSERDIVQPGQIYYLERKAKRAKIPFHVVQKNQTLREISNVYGVRLKSLLKFNRILPTQRVQTGRIVWLRNKRPQSQPVAYKQEPVQGVPTTAPPIVTDSLARRIDSVRHSADSLPLPVVAAVPTQTTAAPAGAADDTSPNKNLTGLTSKAGPADVNKADEMPKLHVVKRGQTYYRISQLYNITLQQLYAWNKLSERIPLKTGQRLIVGRIKKQLPTGSKPGIAAQPNVQPKSVTINKAPTVNSKAKIIYHIVKAEQTVYRVALIHNVSVPDLMRWNNLRNYTIEIGQKLLIRKKK